MSRHFVRESKEDQTFNATSRTTWAVLKRVAIYLKPYPILALGTIGCAILSLLFAFAYPKLTEFIIDDIIAGDKKEWLLPAIFGMLAAFFFRDLFNSLRIRINNIFEQNVIFDMRKDVYTKLQTLPINYFDQRASGDLMTRVIEDINSVERVLIDGTEQGTISLLSIVGVAAILYFNNPTLAMVAAIPIPLLFAGAAVYTLTAHERYRVQRKASSRMNALLMDNLQGIRQIKSFGRLDHESGRFDQRAEQMRQGNLQIMLVWALYSPIMSFAAALGTVLVLWIGGGMVLDNRMQIGELVSFVLYLNLFYDPINKLHGLNQMLQGARAAGERVFDILDTEPERAAVENLPCLKTPVRGAIEYRHVEFNYTTGIPVLRDISFKAAPGDMIALVGPTGAGKSTLVNLLTAFYELEKGSITIDGQDLSKISINSVRNQISVVSQEAYLFNGTIRENILYGRLDALESEMIQAAKAANCHEFIMQLPDGYDSRVGERGVKLSVGEKQRVSIARALLKNAPLLVLDEATASVDTATERLIQEALSRLMADRTSFVIAHRLSTIRKADQILVIRDGRIEEKGNHEELLEANGLYAGLCSIQDTSFVEESFEKLAAC
jgi:ATP-binding cassette subfamily B protein/subfamily B ATP-binding cassette protein MsbA